jgi:DNA-directed RNA polymerase subunit beta
VVDQTNPLSMLVHERRLSALGPGGLNRKRAGFEVRDVHISHYGRICPIETPEGTNIGLIASLGIFSQIDDYGFLLTPYQKVKGGKVTGEIENLRADQEMTAILAPTDALDDKGRIAKGTALARVRGDLAQVPANDVQYVDVSPKQIVGVSAALIPFLEHDDANRALMGSNMQRQAVPLIRSQPPLVGTGMEKIAGHYSSMLVKAKRGGTVTQVTNRTTNTPNFVNAGAFDYRPTAGTPGINGGTAPGVGGTFDLTPLYQYVHPTNREPRPLNGVIDIGAYELTP